MAILIINAPKQMAQSDKKKSFDSTFATGVGEGYAISSQLYERCRPGCRVVLLSKDERKRGEGKLVRLVPTSKAGNGIQRYDVYIEGLTRVPYRSEPLNRNGVAVIG